MLHLFYSAVIMYWLGLLFLQILILKSISQSLCFLSAFRFSYIIPMLTGYAFIASKKKLYE